MFGLKRHLDLSKMSESPKSTQKNVKSRDLPEKSSRPSGDEKYAVIMETSGEECESWYYSIRYKGNEKNLEYLQKQLETVDWYILDDLSTFDLDLDHFISAKTAKELTKLELNSHSFHKKFDGVLDRIHLGLKRKDKNEKKMVKVFDILGYGQIEDYIDSEDIDDEDLTDSSESEEEDDGTNDFQNDSDDNKKDHEGKIKNFNRLNHRIQIPSNFSKSNRKEQKKRVTKKFVK